MTVDPATHRGAFPALDREVRGEDLVYLDNAATTQTPRSVREAMEAFYDEYGANVHRGIHDLSYEASVAYEEAHDRLVAFVGASGGARRWCSRRTPPRASTWSPRRGGCGS